MVVRVAISVTHAMSANRFEITRNSSSYTLTMEIKNMRRFVQNRARFILSLVVLMFLGGVNNAFSELPYWEVYRRAWIRSPTKDKQFEEYVAIHALRYAERFASCMSLTCATIREQFDHDVWAYVTYWIEHDSWMLSQYYTMEVTWEEDLTTLHFRYWKQNNKSWHQGYNWRDYTDKLREERFGTQPTPY